MNTFARFLRKGTGSSDAWTRVQREMREQAVHTLSAAQGEVRPTRLSPPSFCRNRKPITVYHPFQ